MLGTALILLGLIIGSAIIMIWIGLRFLASSVHGQSRHEPGVKREVTVNPPAGSLRGKEDVNPEHLGLPLYPGAVQAKPSGSAVVNLDLPDARALRVWAAKFETPDSVQQVSEFYNQHLAGKVTRYQARKAQGKTVFEIKHGGQDRIVAIERQGGKTLIQLARVLHGARQSD